MDSGASIKVTYWVEQTGPTQLSDVVGAVDFRDALQQAYPSAVHARPGDLGGLLRMTVEFVSSLSLSDIATFVASGVAYDVLKGAAGSLVLQPFLRAYARLKAKNPSTSLDVEVLRLVLRDSVVVIYRLSENSVIEHLESVVKMVAENYDSLALRSGETPFEIHVPVFEDMSDDRLARYRVLLDVDETIETNADVDYRGYWGLQYDFLRKSRVYDVRNRLLVDDDFLTQEHYDYLWEERFRRRAAAERK